MAKVKINTGGKILIALLGVGLIAFASWKWLIPHKKGADSVKPEFKEGAEQGSASKGGDDEASASASGDLTAPGMDRPLKVQIFTWGGFAGGIVANNGKMKPNKESIFWKKYDIAVELNVMDDWAASRQAFKKGNVDVIGGTVVDLALEYKALEEHNPQAFMFEDWSRGGDAIAVTKEIQSVEDLKGKRVAVPKGTPSHYYALYLLHQADMATGDINWVWTTSQVEAATFFEQGKVDAAVSWSPDVYMAADKREGGHILSSTNEATHLIPALLIAKGDFIDEHPEALGKFLMGWFEGVEKTRNNPEAAAEDLASVYGGVNKKAAQAMLKDTHIADYGENLRFFEMLGEEPRGFKDIFNEANNLWRSIGMGSGRFSPDTAHTTKILEGIREEAEERFGSVEKTKKQTQEFQFESDDKQKEKLKDKEAMLTRTISVHFDTGSDKLGENAKIVLDEAARLAQTFGKARLRVEGHTSSTGNRQDNIELSENRADSVVDYLVEEHGFPRDKFVVVGKGPDDPIASNDTEKGRAKNRRTEFKIVK